MKNFLKAGAYRVLRTDLSEFKESVSEMTQGFEFLQERLHELETEDLGWVKFGDLTELDLTRDKLREICREAFIYWLKNPLIKSAIRTQTMYVFGQGVSISAEHPEVNAVVQRFLDDPKNKTELTTQQAMAEKENELQVFSNIFYIFFIEETSGAVRVRTIPFNEIEDIIYNPDDKKDPWYYKRVWIDKAGTTHTYYYADWHYQPGEGDEKPTDGDVQEEGVIYHQKVNCISGMKFGVSEVWAAIDWAKAYKMFLENWATIVRSYARFAWNLTTKGGQKGVNAITTKLKQVTRGAKAETKRVWGAGDEATSERYKTPQAGSAFINAGDKLEPIKTAGATTSADDGRRLLLMVSSATGIFEHYLSGDPSTGNLATAKSMERPMELMFVDRQTLWRDVFGNICQFVIEKAALASGNENLKGTEEDNEWGEKVVVLGPDTENTDPNLRKQPISRQVNVTFPAILEKDVIARVGAIVSAATLNGQMMAGTLPDVKDVSRMLLTALGEDDIDGKLAIYFPADQAVTESWSKAVKIMESLKDGVLAIVQKYEKQVE